MVEGQPRLEGARGEEEPPLGGDDGPDSLNNKRIQNHDGGLTLIVRAAGLEVIWNPGSASVRTPLDKADGAGLSEQQAHPEPGGPVVDDSLTFGTQLRRAMQNRGQRGGDLSPVSEGDQC